MSASSTAPLDLSQRAKLGSLARLLADVRRVNPAADLLLVGALARDLLLHYGHGIAIARATEDVDLAVAVENWSQFESFRRALAGDGRFALDRGMAHRLRHQVHGWIDLLPFGPLERSDGTIAWPLGDAVMDVLGYSEAHAAAQRVLLPEQQAVRVASLPMLAVLKVLAWKDRHALVPRKDAADLMLILRRYLDAGNAVRLHSEVPQLLTETFDYEVTGAWLAGRDARAQLELHSQRVGLVIGALVRVLQPEIDPNGALALAGQMSPGDPEMALRLLTALHAGLRGVASS